jgi:hypothetical protein
MKNWWPFWLLTLIGVPLLLVGYQNCAPGDFYSGSGGGGGGGARSYRTRRSVCFVKSDLTNGF